MSNKLTFEEFLAKRKPMQSIEAALENEIHYAINQFTKNKDEEINELKKKVEELESRDINKMFHKSMMEIVELKKKLEKAYRLLKEMNDILPNSNTTAYLKENV